MTLTIQSLKKSDEQKAINFAIEGMNLKRFIQDPTILAAYGKYFWYTTTEKATDILAAYYQDQLVGVLVLDMKNQSKCMPSFWRKCYVKFLDWVQNNFFKLSSGIYKEINQKMYKNFSKRYQTDGEIIFLAADQKATIKGIGSFLLEEVAKRYPNKHLHLYTDDGCSYQFYDKKGFIRQEEEVATLDTGSQSVKSSFFLYSKVL